MGPILRLSWLVGGQIGAKRGNLRLLGGVRGAKLAPKEALEAPKDAPREPKSVMTRIDGTATHLIFRPGPPPKVS